MSTQFDYLQLFPGKPPPPKKTMLILCLYFQKLFCNTNNYEHVSKCSSRDTVRKFNPSTSSLCLQYSNDDIYSSAQMFVYILTFHVNKPIFLSLVNKISGSATSRWGGRRIKDYEGMFATRICYSELLDNLRLVLMEPPDDYCLSSDSFADQGIEIVPW